MKFKVDTEHIIRVVSTAINFERFFLYLKIKLIRFLKNFLQNY